ncbi:g4291 [Coccomyxa viridis]|uniref:G4291 protein n=1 Tax=Coccomyxa viridis TaxID=1274662 RepID=A0ABP1FPX9_9CHLO
MGGLRGGTAAGKHLRDVAAILIHLALWSQLGVLTRIYLDKLFSICKFQDFGVCLTSEGIKHNTLGAYFTDVASNMLGCFIMGLVASSTTIGLRSKKAMVIFPANSRFQAATGLHVGLRTGYCGSLTTFASWEYSLVTSLIGGLGKEGGQWSEFLWGLVIGLQLSLSSYALGRLCALLIDRYLTPGGTADTDLLQTDSERMAELQRKQEGKLTMAEEVLEAEETGEEPPSQGESPAKPHAAIDIAAAIALALLTALFIALTAVDNSPKHAARRGRWLAVLFGPIGCTLRWALSFLNFKLSGEWNWLPVGTLAANMLACTVNFLIGGTSSRIGKLTPWSTLVTYSIRTGFSGALSTVSTYAAEVHVLLKLIPDKIHAATYAVGSLLLGALLGVLIYGSMVWAH